VWTPVSGLQALCREGFGLSQTLSLADPWVPEPSVEFKPRPRSSSVDSMPSRQALPPHSPETSPARADAPNSPAALAPDTTPLPLGILRTRSKPDCQATGFIPSFGPEPPR
jgi:hypothetical protein